MDPYDFDYREMRDIWADYNGRQEFEHDLINRKTTWLLGTQSILFAAFALTLERAGPGVNTFRSLIATSGVLIAAIILAGVIGLIYSKNRSWRTYRTFYRRHRSVNRPGPMNDGTLQWGVLTLNTLLTLVPDILLPLVFMWVWGQIT